MKFSPLPRIRARLPAQPGIWRIETQYLPIAISFQRLIRRVSVIGLVGNEVRTLHFIDGFNLGKSCQVFVIKDLIIHFSLGRGRDRETERKRRREGREGWSAQCGASTEQTEPTSAQQQEEVRGDARQAAEGKGRGAARVGLCPSERSWSVPMALAARHASAARVHGLSVLSPKVGLVPWEMPHSAEQHWELLHPSLGPEHPSCPALRRARAVLTQMTRFGEPMLEPGGEMEVSDVLLCCGGRKAEDL